jgi:hypothetical protein
MDVRCGVAVEILGDLVMDVRCGISVEIIGDLVMDVRCGVAVDYWGLGFTTTYAISIYHNVSGDRD